MHVCLELLTNPDNRVPTRCGPLSMSLCRCGVDSAYPTWLCSISMTEEPDIFYCFQSLVRRVEDHVRRFGTKTGLVCRARDVVPRLLRLSPLVPISRVAGWHTCGSHSGARTPMHTHACPSSSECELVPVGRYRPTAAPPHQPTAAPPHQPTAAPPHRPTSRHLALLRISP